jgi:6-oxo-cyclohex-1-ene-carbonyl-CoA hydrolase
MGIIAEIVPSLKVDGTFVPNPLVETSRYVDDFGRIVHGESKTGEALKQGKALLKKGEVDLSQLDEAVEQLCAKFIHMFPECLTKTLEELRKPKIIAWNANKENSRSWLALNMMTEARAGFRAFNEPAGGEREIDFIGLRQALAAGKPWTKELTESLLPAARAGK